MQRWRWRPRSNRSRSGMDWEPNDGRDYLLEMAAVMRRRRFELAAWEVYECGKVWREADGDVCEAIDFCEYYARGAMELEREQEVYVPGEENRIAV